MQDINLSSYAAFNSAMGGWLTLFASVIASFAAVTVIIDERTKGTWRLIVHRTGKMKYNLGGCIFFMFSGGLVMALGYALFGIMTAMAFPPLQEYQEGSIANFFETSFWNGSIVREIYDFGGLTLVIAAQISGFFFYGICCTLVPMVISAFCENKYIIICVPFFLKYAVDRISMALISASFNSADETLLRVGNIIDPDSIASVFFYAENTVEIILLNLFLIIFSLIFFYIISSRSEKYV